MDVRQPGDTMFRRRNKTKRGILMRGYLLAQMGQQAVTFSEQRRQWENAQGAVLSTAEQQLASAVYFQAQHREATAQTLELFRMSSPQVRMAGALGMSAGAYARRLCLICDRCGATFPPGDVAAEEIEHFMATGCRGGLY